MIRNKSNFGRKCFVAVATCYLVCLQERWKSLKWIVVGMVLTNRFFTAFLFGASIIGSFFLLSVISHLELVKSQKAT